ncbi:hypothetical protein F4805DRAFT_36983 [Annulohypoxylon moriforme]|nr:hypothetical protein F4805DRAFT_36983 [Annulohypoxylon moriforme]
MRGKHIVYAIWNDGMDANCISDIVSSPSGICMLVRGRVVDMAFRCLQIWAGWAGLGMQAIKQVQRRFVSLFSFGVLRAATTPGLYSACLRYDIRCTVHTCFFLPRSSSLGRTTSPIWGWLGIHGDFFSFLIIISYFIATCRSDNEGRICSHQA